jgi:hypothetical protein
MPPLSIIMLPFIGALSICLRSLLVLDVELDELRLEIE